MNLNLDSWQALGLLLGIVAPAIVGLVTRDVTRPTIKSFLLLGISALTGFGSQALQAHQAGAPYNAGQGLVTALGAFVLGVATHYGVLIPTGATAALQAIGSDPAHPVTVGELADDDTTPPNPIAPEILSGNDGSLDTAPDPADDGSVA